MNIGLNSIVDGLWKIKSVLIHKYGITQAESDIAPLEWYIGTGRATIDFMKLVFEAKPFMIARKLHDAGSYDKAIENICKYVKYERRV